MRPDLIATREALRGGLARASEEIEASITLAQSPACDRAFLKTHFTEARAVAARPGSVARPLAGLGISVKDLFDIAGDTTAAGSVVLAEAPAAGADSPAVARLRAAGGAILGRTNMTEFAFSGLGLNPHYGTPRNPHGHDVPRIPGGSSSGSAVAVAKGLVPVAIGTEIVLVFVDAPATNVAFTRCETRK